MVLDCIIPYHPLWLEIQNGYIDRMYLVTVCREESWVITKIVIDLCRALVQAWTFPFNRYLGRGFQYMSTNIRKLAAKLKQKNWAKNADTPGLFPFFVASSLFCRVLLIFFLKQKLPWCVFNTFRKCRGCFVFLSTVLYGGPGAKYWTYSCGGHWKLMMNGPVIWGVVIRWCSHSP